MVPRPALFSTATCLLALCFATANPQVAMAADCPESTEPGEAGVFVCTVTEGDSTLEVQVKGGQDGSFLGQLSINGVSHYGRKFYIFEVGSGIPPASALVSAAFEQATGTIDVVFDLLDTEFDTFVVATATVNLALDDQGAASEVNESVTITSTVSDVYTGRLYSVTDFELDGTEINDSATGNIVAITFTDGASSTTGEVEVADGAGANAFEASLCCDLPETLELETIVPLTNVIVPGPEDLLAAFSWDKTFSSIGDSLQTTIVTTVTVPEPGSIALQGASLMTMVGLARWRRRGQRAGR